MTPAIECRCGERFETPRPAEATAGEMVTIINNAAEHVRNFAGFLTATRSHLISCNLSYEPITGSSKTHIDFHTKEAITEKPKKP